MVGINCDRKTKQHSCKIEKIAKSDTNSSNGDTNSQNSDTIRALLDCGELTDMTPGIRRNKKYMSSK